MIKWRACDNKIEPVNVITESTKFVTVRETDHRKITRDRRHMKINAFDSYHDTWEAAHAHLLNSAYADVEAARSKLKHTHDHLDNIKGMRAPAKSEEAV